MTMKNDKNYVVRDGCSVAGWAYLMDVSMVVSYAPAFLLNQIHVAPKARGKGFGKELMTQITEDADREGYTIVASFSPEEFGSDPDRLMKFYEEFDFFMDDSIQGLRRNPR